jgi:hypothetical protein
MYPFPIWPDEFPLALAELEAAARRRREFEGAMLDEGEPAPRHRKHVLGWRKRDRDGRGEPC